MKHRKITIEAIDNSIRDILADLQTETDPTEIEIAGRDLDQLRQQRRELLLQMGRAGQILDYLKQCKEASAGAIAEACEMPFSSAQSMVKFMAADGRIVRVRYGYYALPNSPATAASNPSPGDRASDPVPSRAPSGGSATAALQRVRR